MSAIVNHNQNTGVRKGQLFPIQRLGGCRPVCLIGVILLACLLGVYAPCQGNQVCAQTKLLTQGGENYRNLGYRVGDIEVKIHVGLSGNSTRSGRYAPIHVMLKNNGKDFEGRLRFYSDVGDMGSTEKRTVVEKQIQIAAGETKEYSCFAHCDSKTIQTVLCDKQGKILEENDLNKQQINTNEYAANLILFGLISEDNAALEYLVNKDNDCRAEEVQDWMLTGDWRMLDCLDVLIINQFDTTQLSEKQIKSINEWIYRGGSLILGTGAQPEKTLKAFSGNLLQGTIGSVKRISTEYGTDLDISELQMDHMKSVLDQGGNMLVGQMDYGKGSVMVASFDLATGMGGKLPSVLAGTCYLHMSEGRRREIQENVNLMADAMDYTTYYGEELSLSKGLDATEVNGLPNVMLYAVLLLLYAVFIGPVLYSILRKRGKRERLWCLIPVSAVVCSVLIYLIGTSTRVKHPYVNYLSQIDLSNQESMDMQTYLTVTSPNNDPFDLELPEKDVIPYRDNGDDVYYYSGNQEVNSDYQSRIEYLDDQTVLHMDNMSAFDSISFRQRQKVKPRGQIQFADLNLTYNALQGIVTNQSGYDLEQCAIVFDGVVLSLGDMKRGKSISLDQLDLSESWIQDRNFDGSVAAKAVGYNIDGYNSNDVQGLRRAVMMQKCVDMAADCSGYYFYGFTKSHQSTEFTDQYDVDLYGETAVIQKLDSGDLGKEVAETVASLDIFALDLPENYNGRNGLSTSEYTVHYSLENTGEPGLLQLSYPRGGNREFALLDAIAAYPADAPFVDGYLFLGTVYGVNQESGKREALFTAGQEGVVTDLAKYIDKNNNLELIYQINGLDEAQYPNQSQYYDFLGLPRLILERRSGS